MLCKWCGMESSTTDKCSWCHRPFATPGPVSPTAPHPQPAPRPGPPVPLRRAQSPLAPLEPPGDDDMEDSPLAHGRSAPAAPRAPMIPGAAEPPSARVAPDVPEGAPAAPARPAVRGAKGGPHFPAPGIPQMRTPAPAPGPAPISGRAASPGQSSAPAPMAARPAAPNRPLPAPGMPQVRVPIATGPAPTQSRPHVPAPGMPPLRPSSTPVPLQNRHVPAPGMPQGTQQNRSGPTPGSTSTGRGAGPAVAPGQRPAVPPAMLRQPAPYQTAPTAPERMHETDAAKPMVHTHAASIAHGMPAMESGGLADGMSAPKSFAQPAELRAPALNTIHAEQSKYYTGQMVDPTSGTHYDGATGRPTSAAPVTKAGDIELVWDDAIPMTTLVARYLCALAGIVGITCLLAHAYKEYYVITLLAALFVAGVLLPIMNVVPKQRDDSDDVWIFALLIMVMGPSIGLIIYAVIGLLRQSANPAVIGCFVVSIVIQLAVYLSAFPTLLVFGPPWVQQGFDVRPLLLNWAAFAALAGWASANVFHRFDE